MSLSAIPEQTRNATWQSLGSATWCSTLSSEASWWCSALSSESSWWCSSFSRCSSLARCSSFTRCASLTGSLRGGETQEGERNDGGESHLGRRFEKGLKKSLRRRLNKFQTKEWLGRGWLTCPQRHMESDIDFASFAKSQFEKRGR